MTGIGPAPNSEFKRAIELNQGYPTAHAWYGEYLMALGRFDESQREMARAIELNPVSPVLNLALGYRFYYARQFDQAVEQIQKTLAAEPSFVPAHVYLARAWQQTGKHTEALAEFRKALQTLAGRHQRAGVAGPGLCRRADTQAEARKTLAELKDRPNKRMCSPLRWR